MLITKLDDRSVISFSGEDTVTFLQGIVTSDINQLDYSKSCYASLLTPQGKLLDEFILITDEARILMDCASSRVASIINRLSLYKLRAEVEIIELEQMAVHVLLQGQEHELSDLNPVTFYPDPRHPKLGTRFLISEAISNSEPVAKDLKAPTLIPESAFRDLRLSLGIAECPEEIEPQQSYPLEFGFDQINAISFSKGCYVGQEVTARMKTRNLSKRYPIVVNLPQGTKVNPGDRIRLGDIELGGVIAVSQHHALGLVNKSETITLGTVFNVLLNGREMSAHLPEWGDFKNG